MESVFRGWQEKRAPVVVSHTGNGTCVAFSGKIRGSRNGTWVISNGRAGFFFDARYATWSFGDPTVVPEPVRSCAGTEFVTVIDVLLETGDEFWFGEIRTPA